MGSLGLTGTALAAFRVDVFATGLDLGRFKGENIPGMFSADPTATIRQGQLVSLSSSGLLVAATGANVFGVSRANMMSLGQAVNVDEVLVLTSTTAINLKRANVSNVSVRSAAGQGGTAYTGSGTDFTVNTTNGTVARAGAGAITDGQTVYVTYTFSLTQADYALQGKNFFNSNDDVTQAAGRLAVIQGPSLLYTCEYDTSRTYALTGASSTLYCTSGGQFSNSAANEFVGKVIQLPSASDPFLGVRLIAQPTAI